MKAIRFLVKGRVQGVGYRYFALREAQSLGLVGFARNLPDGDVEVQAEGAPETLEIYADRLAEGPFAASVTRVERSVTACSGFERFSIH